MKQPDWPIQVKFSLSHDIIGCNIDISGYSRNFLEFISTFFQVMYKYNITEAEQTKNLIFHLKDNDHDCTTDNVSIKSESTKVTSF